MGRVGVFMRVPGCPAELYRAVSVIAMQNADIEISRRFCIETMFGHLE